MIGTKIHPLGYARFRPEKQEPIVLGDSLAPEWARLPPDAADCWLFDISGAPVDGLAGVLTPSERASGTGTALPAVRYRSIHSRGLLRLVLGAYLDTRPELLPIAADERGKPFLEGLGATGDLHFNVSHAGDVLLLGFARRRRVGVDVETVVRKHRILDLAERFFHPEEIRLLQGLPVGEQRHCFYRLWTWKEAYLKEIGVGLRVELSEHNMIDLVDAAEPGVKEFDGTSWLCMPLDPGHDCVAALMIEADV
jgi:4'-phosphopantetheinyl transferase